MDSFKKLNNVNIRDVAALPSPEEIRLEHQLSITAGARVVASRREAMDILDGKDNRLCPAQFLVRQISAVGIARDQPGIRGGHDGGVKPIVPINIGKTIGSGSRVGAEDGCQNTEREDTGY